MTSELSSLRGATLHRHVLGCPRNILNLQHRYQGFELPQNSRASCWLLIFRQVWDNWVWDGKSPPSSALALRVRVLFFADGLKLKFWARFRWALASFGLWWLFSGPTYWALEFDVGCAEFNVLGCLKTTDNNAQCIFSFHFIRRIENCVVDHVTMMGSRSSLPLT